VKRANAIVLPSVPLLQEGYVVKSACEAVWSGSGPGDPENPSLGHECVDSLVEAHRFDDLAEAAAEAETYRGGAYVMQGDRIVFSHGGAS
jgi:hypothetical protein